MPDQTYSVTIRATDSVGLFDEWSGSISITDAPPSSFTKLILHMENNGSGNQIFDSSTYGAVGVIQNPSRQNILTTNPIAGVASLTGLGNVSSGRVLSYIGGNQLRLPGSGTDGGPISPTGPFVLEFGWRQGNNSNSFRNDGVMLNPYRGMYVDSIGLFFTTYTMQLHSNSSRTGGGNFSPTINTFPTPIMENGEVHHFAIVARPSSSGYDFRVFKDGVIVPGLSGEWTPAYRPEGSGNPTVMIGSSDENESDNNWTSSSKDEVRLTIGSDLGWWDGFTPPAWPLPND